MNFNNYTKNLNYQIDILLLSEFILIFLIDTLSFLLE